MIISALSTKMGGRKCSDTISTSSEVSSNQERIGLNPMYNPKVLDKSSQNEKGGIHGTNSRKSQKR